MLKIKSKQFALVLGDLALLLLSLYLALYVRLLHEPSALDFDTHIRIFWPLLLLLVAFYYSFDFYDFSPFQTKLQQVSRLINIQIFIALLGFAYFYIFSSLLHLSPKTILILYTLIAIFLHIVWRMVIVESFLKPAQKISTLLIAQGEEFEELRDTVNSHDFYPFYFTSHLDVTKKDLEDRDDAHALKNILEENDIKQVIIDIRDYELTGLLPYLYNLASQRKIDVFDATKVYQDILKKMPLRAVGHFWFFESIRLDTRAYEAVKRVVDIILSLPLILMWVILHPFIYLAIRMEGKGDVFIMQERYGFGGKIIKLYKYRTMTFSDQGRWLKDAGNPNKVTKVGKWLRKSRLDELPQLFSIIQGDISFIGPRPDILRLGGELSSQIPYYMMRYTVRPGLSGWAQVNQDLPPQSFEETRTRLQYDLYYVKNRSFLLDFIIMIRTVKVLILRTGM